MNKLEKISLHSALKSSDFIINKCFYPLLFERFITIDFSKSVQSLYYEYWQEVVDMIKPYLDKENIKILRVGSNKGYELDGTHNYTNKTFNQNAYILSNSMLHASSSGVLSFLAYQFNTPIVCLFSGKDSSLFPFERRENTVLIDSPKSGKNKSLSDFENPKTINLIDPCMVAKSILSNLNVSHDLENRERIFNGEMSFIKTIEIVPDFPAPQSLLPNALINIRADLHFNEANIASLCSNNRRAGIITNKPLSEPLLLAIRNSIQRISINADDGLDESFLKLLKKLNIAYEIFISDKSKLYELRLAHIDEPIDYLEKKSKPLDFNYDSSHSISMTSSKILISKNGSFPTKAHWIIGENCKEGFQSYIDTDDFWEDLDFINIYKIRQF